MKKWTAISLPIFAILSVVLCLLTIVILPVILYMAPTLWIMAAGPPEHMISADAYARFMVSNSEDIDESEIDVVQAKGIKVPETIWVVLTRYKSLSGIQTRLLSYEDWGEGTLHIYSPFFETTQSDEIFDATFRRYSNGSGSQFSVHGNIFDEAITQLTISITDEWKRNASVVDGTYLLIAPWPNKELPSVPIQIMAFNDTGELIAHLTLPSTK